MKKRTVATVKIRYGHTSSGYDFTGQVNIIERYKFFKVVENNTYELFALYNNEKNCFRKYFSRRANVGDIVYTIQYKNGRFVIRKDKIKEIYCYNFNAFDYFLEYGVDRTGVNYRVHFWKNKNEALYALSKLNYFRNNIDQRNWWAKLNSEGDVE